MVTSTKITCRKCGKDTGLTEEGMRYFSITKDIHCPHCNAVVIPHQNIMWEKIADRRNTPFNINKPAVKVTELV